MSLAEILAELPKLLVAERQAVHDELVKLGTFDEDLQFCSEAAAIGAQLLDKLEDEDARSRMG